MGYYKDQAIAAQEDLHSQPLTYEESDEEAHFFHTIHAFEELVKQYGYDEIVKIISPEGKFSLLEAIIKSQGGSRV